MIARDLALSSLYDARDKLTDLIVAWAPDPNAPAQTRADQSDQLRQLILQRDQVNGAINAIIDTAFKSVATPELLKASQELRATSDELEAFGQHIEQVNGVLKLADQVVQAAAKVIALA